MRAQSRLRRPSFTIRLLRARRPMRHHARTARCVDLYLQPHCAGLSHRCAVSSLCNSLRTGALRFWQLANPCTSGSGWRQLLHVRGQVACLQTRWRGHDGCCWNLRGFCTCRRCCCWPSWCSTLPSSTWCHVSWKQAPHCALRHRPPTIRVPMLFVPAAIHLHASNATSRLCCGVHQHRLGVFLQSCQK